MIIIPAIDLLGGGCVRLRQGDYGRATRYDDEDPVERARKFEAAGIRRIHIVDLDAAKGRGDHNRGVIRRIREAVSCLLEVGGGIRTEEDVRELLDLGVDRLILGTLLAKDPETARAWISRHGRKFIAGIDALEGQVKIAGWMEGALLGDLELARRAAEIGVCSIIYTNIARDGMMEGPDIERTLLVARTAGLPVILSGGVSGTGDISAAAESAGGAIAGVITGKAVYEGKIDLAALTREYPQESALSAPW